MDPLSPMLVVGGSGWLGQQLCHYFAKIGISHVYNMSRTQSNVPGCTFLQGSVLKGTDVSAALSRAQPRTVLYLAANTSRSAKDDGEEMRRVNVDGLRMTIEACIEWGGVTKFLVFGSFAEYGQAPVPFREDGPANPTTLYGTTKLEASRLAISYDGRLPICVARFSLLYSDVPRQDTFLGALYHAIRTREPLSIPKERITRDFLHVSDAFDGVVRILENFAECRGEIINLCTGRGVSLSDVVKLAEEASGIECLASTRPGCGRLDQPEYYGDTAKAQRLLGSTWPKSIEIGAREIVVEALSE